MTSRARLLALLPVLLLLGLAPHARADETTPGQVIDIVQIKGDIDAAYANYIVGELQSAAAKHYTAVILRLDSRGTVKTSAERLAAAVRRSSVPVAAWVGPNHAVASGAAALIWSVAPIRFIGPGAEVRSANPFAVGGSYDAVVGRNGGLVARHVSLKGKAAVDAGIAQAVKSTLFEVVKGLDGQHTDAAGRVLTLSVDPTGSRTTVRFANPDLLRRIRHSLASPWLAYLLLVVGVGSLVFELFQPGFGPAGWAGLLGVALAMVGFVGLPTSWAMVALTLAGMAAMTWDVARGGLGPPTWGGLGLFGVGSAFLVHSHGPALRVPVWAVVVGVLSALLFFAVVMTVVLRALRGPTADGGAALVGRVGEVRSPLNPQGHVLVDGALWRARVPAERGSIGAGTAVTVVGLDAEALILDVEPVPERATSTT
jgi:membrane-bound serine protease (ClpP class)